MPEALPNPLLGQLLLMKHVQEMFQPGVCSRFVAPAMSIARVQSPNEPSPGTKCKAVLQTGSNGAVGDVQPVARAGAGKRVIGPRHGNPKATYVRGWREAPPLLNESELLVKQTKVQHFARLEPR